MLLIVITACAYIPAMRAGWIWDDAEYVRMNSPVISRSGLEQIWFEPASTPQYYPLVFTTLWLEYRLWGPAPRGYHLINVGLHIVNAILLWMLLLRLEVPGAFLAAGIFALHPVEVESVAWVTELKNVLSTTCYLLAVLFWLRFVESRRRLHYGAALGLFVGAMLSKTVTCTLPLVLILLTWWKAPRAWRWTLPRIVPFLIVAAGLSAITVWREPDEVHTSLSLIERLLIAGRAVWFYAAKLVFPVDLMMVYPQWTIDAHDPLQYIPLIATLAVPITLWALRHRIGTGPLVGVLFFLITLAPSLGVLSFAFMLISYVADHFQYLASIGLIALCAAVVTSGVQRLAPTSRWLHQAIIGLIFVGLAVSTWRQARIYKDEETLWRDNLAKNPQSSMAHWSLGQVLVQQGRVDDAIQEFAAAARPTPSHAGVYQDWAEALDAQGKSDQAMVQYETALRLNPKMMMAHFHLGNLLFEQDRVDEASRHFAAAVQLDPNLAPLRVLFGTVLAQQGDMDAATHEFAEAVRLEPNYAGAHTAWAAALSAHGKLEDAVQHYEIAAQLQPGDAEAQRRVDAARAELAARPQ